MATINEAISVHFGADMTDFNRAMGRARGQVDRGTKQMSSRFAGLTSVIGRAAVAIGGLFAASQVARAFFTVNLATEKLQASLRTVTGSAEAASAAFASLEEFTKQTPDQVEDVVGAFIKLKALGLDPSERALRAYGNTAAAMGKSLNDMIEAVADASTMEFERLKEFGIKARQQGDQVAFTFQGVTTVVEKNAADITEFLQGIGEVNFAGAMAEQMRTMSGIMSNIRDNANTILRIFGDEGGVNAFIRDVLTSVAEWTGGLAENRLAVAQWGRVTIATLVSVGRTMSGFGVILGSFFRQLENFGRGLGFLRFAMQRVMSGQFDVLQGQFRGLMEMMQTELTTMSAGLVTIFGALSDFDEELNKALAGAQEATGQTQAFGVSLGAAGVAAGGVADQTKRISDELGAAQIAAQGLEDIFGALIFKAQSVGSVVRGIVETLIRAGISFGVRSGISAAFPPAAPVAAATPLPRPVSPGPPPGSSTVFNVTVPLSVPGDPGITSSDVEGVVRRVLPPALADLKRKRRA